MKVNLLMIWLKVSEYTSMQMDLNTLDTGTKTNNTDLEKKNGMMEVNIKVFTKMLPKKDKENIAGLMETDMLVNGKIICLTEKDFLFGMTIDFSLENGKII